MFCSECLCRGRTKIAGLKMRRDKHVLMRNICYVSYKITISKNVRILDIMFDKRNIIKMNDKKYDQDERLLG